MKKAKPNDFKVMSKHVEKATKLLKSIANGNRLMILCSLVDGELSVTALNEYLSLSQSALSQHLAYLRQRNLVKTRREAQTIYYQLSGDEAIKIIQVLKSLYCA